MFAADFFSFKRFNAIVGKEFVQMRRDRVTLAMMIGIPILQMIIFGFAINSNPKHLPTVILAADHGVFSRTIIAAMQNSEYFQVVKTVAGEEEADRLIENGEVQFVLDIPQQFSRRLVRGEKPALLLTADATDPAATSNALAAFRLIAGQALARDLAGPLRYLRRQGAPLEVILHRRFNPEAITQYNIVPGLMGVVLTMTLVIITALAITRERERGTMENLLSTPVKPMEVMIGKIIPYIVVGYVQMGVILLAGRFLFGVPLIGSLSLLLAASLLFIAANLGVGLTFSTLARNQLQAVQMAFFFFLPSILLSGFMFPFRGMPAWAQRVGEILPLTHYLRIVRGILLKGNSFEQILPHLWPIMAFLVVALTIGLKRYRGTLD
ncbi:inner membrane transport permease YbhS [bacterium BMS3Bbin14]|nr:inner membrane transport permease YbhS [bacterium BMS3Abin13]GBE53165.1 inner membrane transport permease YbhS [bacterium BMS3Bbin14]HDK42947.1 ABC transporter permease [Desulfobacteraceae bacterium]HDL98580.1 ABC transporter permease [Desulfobacteraceae bacterium]HDO30057.1 ABC transporter permease [Desulfobacteraceae bacterium]